MSGSRRGLYFGYGIGSIGTGLYNTVPGLLLLFYMTNTLGIPAWLAGLGIFVPKLWDVITDPWMGSISDRTESRWGRRRPWLLASGLTLPVLFALLFMAPDFGDPMLAFAWVLGFYVLCATAFTMFVVPYVAMPAEMTDDPAEVTRLMAWRMAMLTVGVLVSGAVAPLLRDLGGGGREGYALMSSVLAGVLMLALLGTFVGTRKAPMLERSDESPAFWSSIAGVLKVRPFVVLTSGYFLQLIGVGAVLATVPYFARYTLAGDEGTETIMFVCLVGPALVTMPVWVIVAGKLGKLRAYVLSLLLFGVFGASLGLATPSNLALVYAQIAVMGIGWAGTQLFPFSMLPDLIAADRAATGLQREGVFTGLWMAVDKGALAVGALLAGLILDGTGFVESEAGQVVVQPDSALVGIRVNTALLPLVFVLVCLPLVLRYDLGRMSRGSERT
ncbi:MAG: MFS transporter [Deltaproteobacteria bacterium]|nr:MFS transporter [Deltaproteobacteria bacterium]